MRHLFTSVVLFLATVAAYAQTGIKVEMHNVVAAD